MRCGGSRLVKEQKLKFKFFCHFDRREKSSFNRASATLKKIPLSSG